MTATPAADRTRAALTLVRAAERAAGSLPRAYRRRPYWVRGRVVRRPDLPEPVRHLVPVPLREGWDTGAAPPRQELRARITADVLVLAKFDLGAGVKLRAAYADSRRTLALTPVRPDGGSGVQQTVLSSRIVSRHAPGLMPSLVEHGRLGARTHYLVEGWLEGRPLMSARRLAEAAPAVLDGLARVHAGYGINRVSVRDRWGEGLATRWQETVATGVVPAALGEEVTRLIAADRTLRCSWAHGDLVASNVLATDEGVVLLDWEHAAEAPVMSDAAKLHLFAADPQGTLRLILDALGSAGAGAGGYHPRHELALMHAQLLGRYPRRRAALQGHPRATVYEKQVRRQLRRLAQVMDLPAG